jgi:hypothetical protein
VEVHLKSQTLTHFLLFVTNMVNQMALSVMSPGLCASFHPLSLFQWYLQSKEILSDHHYEMWYPQSKEILLNHHYEMLKLSY